MDDEVKREWEVGALKPKSVENRTSEELSQIAKDIANNLIFTDFHIPPYERRNLHLFFMPLVFGAFSNSSEEYVKDIGMIFEYYSKAGPTGINGMPVFFSLQYLSLHDTKIVWEKVAKIEELMKSI